MERRRIVVSLGGNAFARPSEPLTMAGQFAFAEKTLSSLSEVLRSDIDLLITHGNGPQVGYILTRVEKALGSAYNLPLEVCVAESEGELGYVLQQTLHNLTHGQRNVITLLTQVLVDPDDPAFAAPGKPIGPFLDKAAAERLRETGLSVIEDAGRGYRRVVPSPKPLQVIELETILTLLNAHHIVIAAGGGGVPVIDTPEGLQGVEAVIDKDFATALLAKQIHADRMVLVTSVDAAYINYGQPGATAIGTVSADQISCLLAAGHFSSGSMKPKIEASLEFVRSGGAAAVICHPSELKAAIQLQAGTRIMRSTAHV